MEDQAAALRDLLERYVATVWDARDAAAATAFLDPDYRRHGSPLEPPTDREGQLATLRAFHTAFPDGRLVLEQVGVTPPLVWFRSTFTGTHRGPLFGVEATGRSVRVALLDCWRVQDGRVAEQWGGPDRLDLLRQLGALE